MKAIVTAAIWIIWMLCMAVMKKIKPKNSLAYSLYGAFICVVFTVLVVWGVI